VAPYPASTMPFYSNDNITTWFYTVFEEDYEHSDDQDNRDNLREMILDIPMCSLKEYCENAMDNMNVSSLSPSFNDAILNSVDWVLLKQLLKEYIEEQAAN